MERIKPDFHASRSDLVHKELTDRIIAAAIDVHKQLGPGLLESVYLVCLTHELGLRGIGFEQEKPLPVVYKGQRLDGGFRIDILVESLVIVELKSVEALLPVHEAQLLTYLKLTGIKVGLLLNFNVSQLRNGIRRFVL